ncbi:MAG: rhomboid family intramembrane serine protease [Bacteroidetes bacterium]|nr:rhomboid family intramembrane serine protease [Bacteroidota bacterium]
MEYYQSPLSGIKSFFRSKSALSLLILINIVIFLIINIINLFYWLFTMDVTLTDIAGASKVTFWLAVPSDLHLLLARPWTIVTYMFTQESFFHILFNMMVLYFGGRIFTEFLDDRKLVNTYIWGGLAGALFFIVSYNIFPVFSEDVRMSVALGASASVLAILVAIATYAPNYKVYLLLLGRIKLKYLAIVLVIIDLLSINRGNPGGHIAHLGGALWGFSSVMLYRRGLKNFPGINWYGIKNLFTWFDKPRYARYKEVNTGHPLNDDEYNRIRAEKQKKIDIILDKISKSGYDSLTKEEKELLFSASNKK